MAPKHKPKNNNKPKNTPSNNTKRQDQSDSFNSGVNKTSNNNTMSEPNVGRSLNSNNQANSNNGNNNIRRNTSTSSITSTDSNSSNDGSNSPLPNQRRNNINPSNSKKNNNLSNNNSISPTSPSNHQTKRRQHVPPPLNTNLTPKPSERIELVWTSVKASFKPPVRGFHSCTLVGDKLYIIGGDNRVEHFKDVWIYDLKNNYWIKITENSHLPMPRTGHSAVLYQDKVYLFGGKNENYYTSDLFIYDLKEKVWVKDVQPHNKKISLTPRAAHSCCCVDDKMYIFGGITSYQANDGRKASEYIDVLSMYDISQRRWKKPKNKGTAPSARAGHSCCVINRDIYIFGGRQGTILFNDLYKYNVDSEKWTKIQTKGDAPQPSAGHTMSAYVDKIVILGGSDWKKYPTEIYVFHIPSKVWIKCISLGITTGRFWHTATVYDDNLYVYGGGTGELVDDMYCINLRSLNNISEATALTPQSSASPVPLPEIPVQSFTSTLKFKTIYKAEMRVFAKVPRDVTYLELKETISKSYGFPVVLKYVELDDEKDEITIGSDRELKDFIECFEEMGKGLRLELSEQKAREPESDTDSGSETDHEEDMQSTTDGIKWRKGGLLGKGAYGEVYKGLNVNTGQWMAVKIIDLSATSEKEQKLVEKQIFNEINLMKDLCHENIVRYLGAEFNRKKTRLFIYIELVDGGSLSEILKNVGPLDESVVRQYTRQILFGLKYLHDKNIIHRDIKGGNILIETKSGTIKLADFGHSKKITENVQASLRICGTPMWMAPEIIKESKYSKASDIWSVACTIIEMLTAEVPFPDLVSFENTGVMFKIATGAVPKIPENLSEEGKLFLGKCFSQNPNSRPTVDDLLHEPFLRSLRYVGVSYPNDETSSEEEEEEDDEFPSIDDSSYEEDTNSFDKGKRPISTESEEFDGMENPNPNNKGKGPLVEDEEDEDEDFTDEDEDEDEDFSDDESESSYSEDKSSQSITQQLRNIQANNPILSMGLRGNLPTQSQVAQVAQLRRAPPPLVSTPSTGTLRGVLRNDIQMNPYIAQTVTQVAATPSTTLNIGSSASHSKTVTKSACDNDVMSFLQTKKQSNQ